MSHPFRFSTSLGALAAEGIVLAEVRREWDEQVWPKSSAGFFKVKKAIPGLLDIMSVD